jgi:enoyl-CoA hydratase
MFQAIKDAVARWESDPNVYFVVVAHAEGSRGFCSGGDISMFVDAGSSDPTESRRLFRTEYSLNVAISRFPKPYLGIIDGISMGGGIGITIHGSHRVATENTVFAMPETGIGLFPDVGSGYFLSRLPGEIGTWLGLTGARLKGSDVTAIGIATHYIPSTDIPQLKYQIAQADFSNDAAVSVDRIVSDLSVPVPAGSYLETMDVINRCFGHDRVEEIITSLRNENSDWADQQLETIRKKCPTSLKLGLRLIREGKHCRTLAEDMRTEFRIVWRRVTDADLAKGVRGIVVDRSRQPQWSPATVEEVTDELVDTYFEPLGEDELPV